MSNRAHYPGDPPPALQCRLAGTSRGMEALLREGLSQETFAQQSNA